MGNQNLIWDAFVANVECCPIGYEIRRVFTQPGPKADIEYDVYSIERQNQEQSIAAYDAEVSLALGTTRRLYRQGR